ncbi:MAG: 1-acyl-sn-glycerol-3-phosphate acyltransferase [Rubrivivax sp.]|nr:1-acyl-sn-glycerol-3-phosphate acyltransferase [Rubrivivax sp.]
MKAPRPLRGVWRLARAVLHGLRGLAIVLLLFPRLDRSARQGHIRRWSATMFGRMGMTLQLVGTFKPGSKLIVANHVSWLDILAVHAACPEARFVSKADVREWPLVSRLVDAGETLYIERERKRDAMRVVHQTAEALARGDTVAVFPEGTTGPGPVLLPFHANLLQAAIAAEVAVQPVVLRYADRHGAFSPDAEFLGETTLAQSLWKLACADAMTVHVMALSPVGARHADRRALAAALRESIDAELAPFRR